MGKELDFLLQRFPRYRGLALVLYGRNEDFRAICDDYWQCSKNLEKLEAENVQDSRLLREYNLMKLELETEALHLLDSFSKTIPIHLP